MAIMIRLLLPKHLFVIFFILHTLINKLAAIIVSNHKARSVISQSIIIKLSTNENIKLMEILHSYEMSILLIFKTCT